MTKLMAILNVTPDSFSDKGKYFATQEAIQKGLLLDQEGADWIDIGGESTRPGAIAVTVEEEIRRVIPVMQGLRQKTTIPLSVDTRKPEVAEVALANGAHLINDVSGFRDPKMRELAAQSKVPICVMHMHETPQTMQLNIPLYEQGIVHFLCHWFVERIELLLAAGVEEKNIILDPGIGFGKTVADNIEIIENLSRIKALGFPILVGLSNKSFLSKIVKEPVENLLPATLVMNTLVVQAQTDIIRVHNVSAHRQLLQCVAACTSLKKCKGF